MRLVVIRPSMLVAVVVAALVAALAVATPADAAPMTYTVTKTADTADGTCDADCSLREAITAANANAGQDTIMVPAGSYTITLAGASENANATGDLDVTDSVVIRGAGSGGGGTIVNGGGDGDGGGTTDRVLHLMDDIDVSLHDVRITNGDVSGAGGGIEADSDSVVLTLNTVRVDGNASTGSGGGLYLADNTVATIMDSRISGNSSVGTGGGLYVNYASAVLTDTIVDGNTASSSSGGGIYNSYSNVEVTGGSVSDNTSDREGGAMYLSYANATFTDTTMDGNTADQGGALSVDESQTLLTRVSLDGNTAVDYGGTIETDYSNVVVIDSPISNSGLAHTSTMYGGAIYNYESNMELVRSPISDTTNTSGGSGLEGGAIYNEEARMHRVDSPITGTTSTGLTSTAYGGALGCEASLCSEEGDNSITGTSVTSTATVHGGAVYVYEAGMTITGDVISNTTVETTGAGYGGGIFVEYGGIELVGVTMENNLLDIDGTAEGGAVHLSDAGEGGTFRNSVFRNNTAGTAGTAGYGGAIDCADDYGGCTIEDSLFENNTATYTGGAVTWYEAGVTVRRSTFRGNSAFNPDTPGDDTYGGAFGSDDYGAILIEDSLIEGNSATYEGGGLYLYDAPGIIRDTIIQDNVVDDREDGDSGYGGGISLDSSNPLILERSIVQRNTVIVDGSAYGGGLYGDDGAVTVRDTAFIDNTATSRNDAGGDDAYGGAIALDDDDVPLRAERSLFAGNDVASNDAGGTGLGGAVWSDGSTTLFENTTFSANTADEGAALWTDTGGRFTNATLVDNVADDAGSGAIHVDTGGYTALKASAFAGNGPDTCAGDAPESRGFNVADDSSCGLDLASDDEDTDPLLGPLAFHGGYTDTHMPADASPVIDHAGDPCTDITDGYEIVMDGRGAGRPGGAACDSGAVEVGVGVTVTATDDDASEVGPDEGIFTFARPDTDGELDVTYVVSGSATADDDYTALSGTVTFPDGDATVTVDVDPVADEVDEGDETVTVTLEPGTLYTVATPDTATVTIADTPAVPAVDRGVDRLAGEDRYATAAAIVLDRYDPADVDTVFLATGQGFPDALAGGPLAIANGAPILISEPGSLPAVIADALGTLDPDSVVALGGPVAISDATLAAAATAAGGATTGRISGPDRYATAAEIADRVPDDETVYLAVGTNFPDALAAGPVTDGAPILLTETDSLPAATAAALADRDPDRVVALGGPVAISDATLAAAGIAAGGAATSRLAGENRYATAVEIAGLAGDTQTVYVAVGTNFPDALAGGPPAHAEDAPIVLVQGTTLPTETSTYLDDLDDLQRVVILGGTGVIPDSIRTQLEALLD